MALAVEQVRRMRGGAQSHLMRCSNQAYYMVKFQNNPQGLRILANELLGTGLAARLGLSVAEPEVVEVREAEPFQHAAAKPGERAAGGKFRCRAGPSVPRAGDASGAARGRTAEEYAGLDAQQVERRAPVAPHSGEAGAPGARGGLYASGGSHAAGVRPRTACAGLSSRFPCGAICRRRRICLTRLGAFTRATAWRKSRPSLTRRRMRKIRGMYSSRNSLLLRAYASSP
jgi:hypothetical protein